MIGLSILPCSIAIGQEKLSRVSVDSSGTGIANGSSTHPCISADGRFIAFSSDARNIVAGDTNNIVDIYVRDMLTGVTEIASVDSAGVQGNKDSRRPSISADGRFVSFDSKADNLVAGDTNGFSDVFVRDRLTQTTIRVSVDASGNESNSDSYFSSISGDGNVVAFPTDASNLVTGDTNGKSDVFVHDTRTGVTERVSVDSAGVEGNGSSGSIGESLSFDGRFVGFDSGASNLVSGDSNSSTDVFVRDRLLGTTQICSLDSSGLQGDAGSVFGSLSSDGRLVVINTFATNLVPNDANANLDVVLRDTATGITELVSANPNGVPGNKDSVVLGRAIDDHARFITFMSSSDDLVAGDRNTKSDIFVRDRVAGLTTRINVDSAGKEADSSSDEPTITADGRLVTFSSYAKNLVPPDFGSWTDVFLRGPYLTMEVDPRVVVSGGTLTFSAWRGSASGALLLAVSDVNGTPLFLPALLSTFDTAGAWTYAAAVPPGLSGNDITFDVYGIVETGKVAVSNAVSVTFQ
jgi:Tol biopolymer transport system component